MLNSHHAKKEKTLTPVKSTVRKVVAFLFSGISGDKRVVAAGVLIFKGV